MRKHAPIVAICLAFLGAVPRLAWACSCMPSGPPCQEVFRAGAVFVGTVLSIDERQSTRPGLNDPSFVERRVHFRVTEPFRGDVGKEVDVFTGMGGGDCGYAFAVGGAYLVYADARAQRLSTGICMRTRSLGQAADDLAFLRAMSSAPATSGRILGVATYMKDVASDDGSRIVRQPFPGAKLSFTSGSGTFAATTDEKGAYSFDAPNGEYQLRVTVPAGFYAQPPWTPITLEDARGCAAADVTVRDDGHIRGRVVDAAGQPVPNLAIELGTRNTAARIQWQSSGERTDADGYYEFSKRPAGEYLVGVNSTRDYGPRVDIGPALFLPGVRSADKSELVTLPSRATIDAPDFVLPDAVRMVQITGVAVDETGVPAAGVRVYLQSDGPELRLIGPAVITTRDGRFAFAATAGIAYKIVGEFPRTTTPGFTSVELRGVRAAIDLPPLKLQLIKR